MLTRDKAQELVSESGLHIDFVDYGIACRIGDTIIYNKNLLMYEDLATDILDHEMRHTSKFTKKDFIMDLVEGSIVTNLIFCFRHPRAFTHFIPIGIYKGIFWLDINLILSYLVLITIIILWSILFL